MRTERHYLWVLSIDGFPRARSRFTMSEETAKAYDPTAEPVPGTMVERQIAETREEIFARTNSRPNEG